MICITRCISQPIACFVRWQHTANPSSNGALGAHNHTPGTLDTFWYRNQLKLLNLHHPSLVSLQCREKPVWLDAHANHPSSVLLHNDYLNATKCKATPTVALRQQKSKSTNNWTSIKPEITTLHPKGISPVLLSLISAFTCMATESKSCQILLDRNPEITYHVLNHWNEFSTDQKPMKTKKCARVSDKLMMMPTKRACYVMIKHQETQ